MKYPKINWNYELKKEKKKSWNYELKLKTNNNQSKYENWKLEPIIIKPKLKENSLEISLYLFVWLFIYFIGFPFFVWLEFSKAQVKV